jgi:hypothetical protein
MVALAGALNDYHKGLLTPNCAPVTPSSNFTNPLRNRANTPEE